MSIERYSFVALTTTDLARARQFWVDGLGFSVTEEEPGDFFIVDAGGLRLCIDTPDGEVHVPGGTDPVIGLRVSSVEQTLKTLQNRGIEPIQRPVGVVGRTYASVRDPDGRTVILTEAD